MSKVKCHGDENTLKAIAIIINADIIIFQKYNNYLVFYSKMHCDNLERDSKINDRTIYVLFSKLDE